MATPAPTIATNNQVVQQPDDDDFKRSYEEFHRYPEILVHHTSYPGTLKGYISRLDEQAPKLFSKDGFEVPFRDYTGHGKVSSDFTTISLTNSLQNSMAGSRNKIASMTQT
jgi:hypothetical protein